MQSDSFYANGLRFSCTECSLCCRFDTGYVFLSDVDIERLRTRFQLSRDRFIERYCRVVDLGVVSRITLDEQQNLDCVFWKHGGCSVYADRPLQCRSFPFWPAHLTSTERWQNLKHECPGIDVGRLHSRQAIQGWIDQRNSQPFCDPNKGRAR